MSVEIIGPFMPESRVTLYGYKVPYLTVYPREDGTVNVVVDGRFGLHEPVSREEFDRWVFIIANAMAVAAGYSCHGENCGPSNPFMTRMSELKITSSTPELSVIEGGKGNNEDPAA